MNGGSRHVPLPGGVAWNEESTGRSDEDPGLVAYLEADFAQFEEWRTWSPLLLAKYIVTQRYQFEQDKEHTKLRGEVAK